ncbi:MAG TPA: hypothetical protein VJQ84_01200 [Solirubrobacterales bacterium]|nr:hypothetical protein [Solirubrobacterales bacterium]
MSEDPKTQIIDGHVFDSDGNPIGANLVLKRLDVDGELCLSVSGDDWYANRTGGEINRADDVQFCVPQSALAEPGVWTVIGVYEDHHEPYPDHPEPQFQRWAEVARAGSPAEAIAAVRKQLGDPSDLVVAACVAGDVRVVA